MYCIKTIFYLHIKLVMLFKNIKINTTTSIIELRRVSIKLIDRYSNMTIHLLYYDTMALRL